MKNSKLDRCITTVVIGACLIKAVIYGGSKASFPTNSPPDNASSPTNAPMMIGLGLRSRSTMESSNLHCTTTTTNYDSLAAWHMRGAYCDWQRIDFPASFRFPVGTNFVDGVTLFAYGEIVLGPSPSRTMECSNLHCTTTPSDYDYSLPSRVSLEHGVSSVSHGLTASNSYLFAWHDCCVERCATNRVDASVELFDSGAIATTVTPLSANQPPITIYQPPIPPEGFVGIGQDLAWATNAFPFAAEAITNRGYTAWLDDYIGYNEPNGRYQVKVTVSALPEHGPCYLYCGPYRVNVAAPGTYCFPLEVFEEYRAYTLPERVPLSFEYDDGYDVEADAPVMAGAPLMAPRSVPDYYIICITPNVYVVPQHVPLAEAVGARLNLHCNCPSNGTWSYSTSFTHHLRLIFGFPSYAEIRTAEVADRVTVLMRVAGHECSGVFYIDPPPPHKCCNDCCGDNCRCDGTCCACNCSCNSSTNINTNATETVP